ncbi:hypothetical protein A3D00_00800 [Candidatus Woesebacteria bacterium RIFCSPHIGHO2_02_FULL_38_9]|uniref:Ribbon-helix-helix protein CopG domain-containing protein n=1 Tax=Candidatus Woesebacteria bacterium RIFCSPHIGHO2_01_FULL_39_28 TaxID=1802496 RepID=A0A1F7Y8S3_9BACT|nr:MAG: hypothetical protein A2627_02125 [Candidatus Woesebacteria bacterium RIFCSPHIGHO2_01_FULL_39_28]OGM33440.1 MAG: hypothetical protein A3D00_00800 [Candidatus Woesebacteria bacterium RIFCSPHIGHO2_02_FULL_38_9]OGM57266.1 MAG: hypothetical protein A3A50_00600 [Candidatus Woesebacteria bacterium RIFCSPLOWO2_01_FULL_38_20]
MNQLTRVQVYLEPQNLIVLDRLAKKENKSRSQIIRDAINQHSQKGIKKLTKKNKVLKNPLLDMAGMGGKSKTGTLGLNIDEIYLND